MLLCTGTLVVGCSPSISIESPDAVRSIDALYTAVTSRRLDLVDETEIRIHSHHASGKLSADAHQHLKDIIATARRGEWQTAAEALDQLIRSLPEIPHDAQHLQPKS